MARFAPISPDAHRLLVRPENHSMVMGLAHHLLFRPANALSGGRLPAGLDPGVWGAGLAKASEGVDYALAPKHPAFMRREALTLGSHDLIDIHAKLYQIERHDPTRGKKLRKHLGSLIENSYNPGETIESLAAKARSNPNFAITLHDVQIPSLTGQWGRVVKDITTDVAAVVGAGEIMRMARERSEKKASMSAIDHLKKAADILEGIPAMEMGQKYANQLVEAGVISANELDKHARIFEENYRRSPDDAEAIFGSILRGTEVKLASMGEAVTTETPSGYRGSKLDQLCLEGAGLRPSL